jgi:polyhydroxybutyrate depolymerase
MRFLAIAAVLIEIAVILDAGEAAAESRRIVLETRDGPRSALVFHAGAQPKPLVVVLHGGYGAGEYMAGWSGLAAAAGPRGFVAVFPDGKRGHWNDGRTDFDGSTADDVEFLKALIDRLVAERVADPRRVFVTGASNGGMMTLRLACAEVVDLAGIATMIANLPASLAGCKLTKPLPIVVINGTADPIVPYDGGTVGVRLQRGAVLSTEQTVAPFAGRNGCADLKSRMLPDRNIKDGSTVTLFTWTGCDAPTLLYRVDGGGHQLPGAGKLPEVLMGKQNRDIETAEIVMGFFADLAKRN